MLAQILLQGAEEKADSLRIDVIRKDGMWGVRHGAKHGTAPARGILGSAERGFVTLSRNIDSVPAWIRGKTLFFSPEVGKATQDAKKADNTRAGCHESVMFKLLIFVGMTVGGWIGWWLGEQVSDGLGLPLFLSGIGTLAGIVAGWWLAKKIEE